MRLRAVGVVALLAVCLLPRLSPAANGDIAIYREATAGDGITTAEYVHDFDTTVRSDPTSYTLSGVTDIQCAAGHHLVIYSSRFDDPANNGTERSEIQSWLRLAGGDLDIGWSQSFIRRQNGDFEGINSGGGIIDVASANDVLRLVSARTDAEADTIQREPDTANIQLVKLDDTWDYCRLSKTANQAGAPSGTAFIDVTYDSQEELDTGSFAHTSGSGDITLKTAGHYLVFANTYFQYGQTVDNRSAYTHRLTLNGTQVDGSRTTVYLRGNPNSDSCCDGTAAIGIIIETTAADEILNVECNKEGTFAQTPNILAGKTAVTIVKLPDNGDYIRLDDSGTDDFNPAATTALGWDTEDEIDAVGFTHADSQVTAVVDDNYLFLTTLYTSDDGNQRIKWWQRWRVDGGTPLQWGQTGRYSRNSESQTSGNWSGVVLGMTAGQYVEVVSEQLGNSGVMAADVKGLQGVRLGSILTSGIPGSPDIYNTAATMVTTTSAWMHATLADTGATATAVWCFWGDEDAGASFAWDATNAYGATTLAPPQPYTNSVDGLIPGKTYYYRFYASNSVAGIWAVPTIEFTTRLVGEWTAAVDGMWGTAGNWSEFDVPDTAGEFALFSDFATGDVDINGMGFTVGHIDFTGGDHAVVNSGAAATLTAGALTNSAGVNTIAAAMAVTGTTDVAGGTLILADTTNFTADAITLSGGTLEVRGNLASEVVPNAVRYAFYDGVPNSNLLAIDDGVTNGQNGGLFALEPDSASLQSGEVWQQGNISETYLQMWWGRFTAPTGGTYTFYVHGDDNEVLWIDVNQNGEFETATDLICNNAPPEGWNVPKTETVDLVGGVTYDWALAHSEGVGGDFVNATITVPGGVAQRIDPSNPSQDGWWSVEGFSMGADTLPTITVTADSELRAGDSILAVAFGDIDLAAGTLTATSADGGGVLLLNSTTGNGTLAVSGNALEFGTASSLGTLEVGGGTTVSGAELTATTRFGLEPLCTVESVLAGPGYVHVGDSDSSDAEVTLLGTNKHTGKTLIERGLLRADEGVGLPINSLLEFSQNNRDQTCILETSGMFARNIGPAAGEVFWVDAGGGGGFAARGGNLTVDLEGGTFLMWHDANQGFNNTDSLQFGSRSADSMVELKNDIMLDGSSRRIQTIDNTSTKADIIRLSGDIFSGNTNSWFRFHESSGNQFNPGDNLDGTLVQLTGSNTYVHATVIEECTLAATEGVGLPTGSLLRFEGNSDNRHAVLMTSGTFTRDIGQNAGEVYWNQRGGFAAKGGDLAVNLESGVQIDWDDPNTGVAERIFQLNSAHADSMVDFQNDIMIDGTAWAYFYVWDNLETDKDLGQVSGVISDGSSGGLRKRKDGTLWLTGTNTYTRDTFIDNGVVRAIDGVGLPTTSQLYFEGDNDTAPVVFESSGTFTRDIANTNGYYVYWQQRGGFSAYGGPLDVSLEGGVELNVGDANTGFRGMNVHLGSRTANDVVDLQNDLYITDRTQQFFAWDNPYSENDHAVVSGDIRVSNWGDLDIRGDGLLKMTGTTTVRNTEVYTDATLQLNGAHTFLDFIYTVAGQAGTIGGSGSADVAAYFEIRSGGTLAPGSDAGTLSVTVASTNGVRLLAGSYYEWELGPAGGDKAEVTGNLELQEGWTLKLLGAGGTPHPSGEYDIFTYTGSIDYNAPVVDASAIPGDWDVSGLTVVHDDVGKRVYITGLYSPLSIVNDMPSSLTDVSAQLNGWLSNSGQVMDAWVYWGEMDGGTNAGSWSNAVHVGSFTNAIDAALTHTITGLTVNTGYAYTFRATNATYDLWAAPSIGFFSVGAPIVANNGVSGILAPRATLHGQFLDHNRGDVTLCWGTEDGGTSDTNDWEFTLALGAQSAAEFSSVVTPVYFGQRYMFRCYAENAQGADWSDVATTFGVSNTVPLNGLMGMWTFDDGTCDDSSGNGYHGTNVGGAFITDVPPGASGMSLDLNGGNNYVVVDTGGNQDAFNLDRLTIACWVREWPAGNWGTFVAKRGENNAGYSFRRYSRNPWVDGDVCLTLRGTSGDDAYPHAGTSINADQEWHHLAATYDGSMAYLYLDGTVIAQEVHAGNINDNVRKLSFGARELNDGTGYETFAQTKLDDIVIYDRALSAWEMGKLYGQHTTATIILANEPPSDAMPTSVQANGNLELADAVYDLRLYWGPTDGTNNPAAWATNAFVGRFTNHVGGVSYTAPIAAGITNYYTYRATNVFDDVWATPSVEVLPVAMPVVNNDAGAIAAVGSATLQGELTAGGHGDVSIFWGSADGGTNETAWDRVVTMADTGAGAFDATVIVGYGPTYHYRCYVTNAVGESWATNTVSFMAEKPVAGTPGVPVTNGLSLWLDAGSLSLADGDPVPTWSDSSGSGNDASQGTANLQPAYVANAINDRPAVDFDGTGERLAYPTVPARTVFFVTTLDPATANLDGIAGFENADDGIRRAGDTAWQHPGDGNTFNNPAGSTFRVNGADTAAVAEDVWHIGEAFRGTGTMNFNRVGGYYNARWLHGDVPELLIYNSVLSAAELDEVGGYLAWKYGITTQYPEYTPPQVFGITNSPISNISTSSATMNGMLAADGWTFEVYACWGTNDAGTVIGNWDSSVMLGSVTNYDGALSHDLTGLSVGPDYFYTFIATNAVTNFPATPSATFQVLSEPTIDNLAASDVTTSSATLNGDLVQGGNGEVTIYWGASDGGASHGAWSNTNVLGAVNAGPVSTNVMLLAGGQYFYRCYVTNALGEDWADTTETFVSTLADLAIADASLIEGDTGQADMVFAVTLSDVSASNVMVNFATADGSAEAGLDYVTTNGTLIIPAGQLSTQLVVAVLGDRVGEYPSEAFQVDLSSPVNGAIGDGTGIGTIVDDDFDKSVPAWKAKMKIVFDGYRGTETLTNFPALVILNAGIPEFSYEDFASPAGTDLRFADALEQYDLNYEIEQWNPAGNSYVWVQVPELVDSSTFIWAYWGNPDATDAPAYTTNGATWTEGFEGVWHMTEINALDSTPNSRHGTAGGAPAVQAGNIGDAVNFTEGTADQVAITGYKGIVGTAARTMSAWIKTTDNDAAILSWGTDAAGLKWIFRTQSANGVAGAIRVEVSGGYDVGTAVVTDGEWHHVAGTFPEDGTPSAEDMLFYVDGALETSSASLAQAVNTASGSDVRIGQDHSSRRFNGLIDEARICPGVRSADWIQASYSNQVLGSAFAYYSKVNVPRGTLLILR